MSEKEESFKNPFQPGDVIWFETQGEPFDFYLILPDNKVKSISTRNIFTLRTAIIMHKTLVCSGPYRLEKAENWSGYGGFEKYETPGSD